MLTCQSMLTYQSSISSACLAQNGTSSLSWRRVSQPFSMVVPYAQQPVLVRFDSQGMDLYETETHRLVFHVSDGKTTTAGATVRARLGAARGVCGECVGLCYFPYPLLCCLGTFALHMDGCAPSHDCVSCHTGRHVLTGLSIAEHMPCHRNLSS